MTRLLLPCCNYGHKVVPARNVVVTTLTFFYDGIWGGGGGGEMHGLLQSSYVPKRHFVMDTGAEITVISPIASVPEVQEYYAFKFIYTTEVARNAEVYKKQTGACMHPR